MAAAQTKMLKRSASSIASFEVLVRKVKETFALGRRRVRREIVRTYWKAGRYIHAHILHYHERAKYGDETILRLSKRVGINDATLDRALKIYRLFPKISSAVRKLELTHLYALSSIPDKKTREEFAERAAAEKWTTHKLAAKIKAEVRPASGKTFSASSAAKSKTLSGDARYALLRPNPGILYTYKIIESTPVQANPGGLKVDQGFSVHHTDFKMRGSLAAGDIVESIKRKDGGYTAAKSKRRKDSLYTYKACVERVVDADTQFVEIDLGFGGEAEQYLRLRGIDAWEINTRKGKKAKAFVEECLKHAPYILLTSSRSDKYDRYLSDIFIPLAGGTVRPSAPEALIQYEGKDFLYLNNELLLRCLAVRMKG